MNIQALWFRKDIWDEEDSEVWCEEHNFKVDSPQHNDTHWIWRQAEPEDGATYRTIADDFPEGISATVMQAEENSMKTKTVKGYQSAGNPMTFILSTEDKDRDGDIIRMNGVDSSDFKKNPIALYQHQSDNPIGVWENIRFEGKKLLADLKLAALGTSEFIDTIHKLVEQRILRAVSIGFKVDDAEPFDGSDPWGGFDIKKISLLEASLVSVPANQNALRSKAAKIIPENLQEYFLTPSEKGSKTRAQNSTGDTPATKTQTAKGGQNSTSGTKKGKPMNIADRIKACKERLVAVKDRMTEIKGLLEADDEYELSDEEQNEIETLKEEEESVSNRIKSLENIQASLASKAVPAGSEGRQGNRPYGHAQPNGAKAAKKELGGSLLVKTISAHLVAHLTQQPVSEVLDEMYGGDERVVAVSKVYGNRRRMQKSAVDAADTTTVGWAAELVQNDLRGFLEELASVSIYGSLLSAPGAQSLEFGGNGTVTIPRRNRANQSNGAAAGLAAAAHLGSQMGGSWVGEGGVIPVKAMALASQVMNRYKLAVISAMTNEILEQSTPNIENIVRSAILEDTALAVDGALLDGAAAVAGVRPASPFQGAATQASSGATAANIITDLKWLLGQLSAINGASPVLIMNSNRLLGLSTVTTAAGGFMFRDDIASGQLLNVPVLSSTTVNPATVGIIDAGSFVGANDAPAFAISDQATLTMANADDTAPSQAGDASAGDASDHIGGDLGNPEQVPTDGGIVIGGDTTGAPAGTSVAGYQAQSMFQQYQTAIRMVMPSSWGMTRTGASAYLTGVAW